MAWSIGDDSAINPWEDIWIPHLGPLRDNVIDPSTQQLYPRFEDLMTNTSSWNYTLLSSLFPADVLPHFASIRYPIIGYTKESCNWRWHDNFSISNAYEKLMENNWEPHSTVWKTICNVERFQRTLSNSAICTIFRTSNETVLQIIRDCSFARDVWNHVSPQASLPTFFTAELHDWILQNINTTATWNSCIFATSSTDYSNVIHHSLLWAKHYSTCSNSLDITTIGGLLRYSSRHWLGGFNRTIGFPNALQVELWAIHDGLCLAWDLGYRLIQIRLDCQKAIAIINDPNALSCQLPLVTCKATKLGA
ncbi:uncharacterized protein LOC120120042 [Hibiscus syriacus]|uniref:uncharacterized protein LOC120120042 n=1 Tax=Hibiscus syriacus TaxID=106335 RepID=UPI001922F303|nr:uncharacterized protein LOC120120042 [Hibiscus syriacus]